MTRTMSGITPSGRLTLGNHLGAMRRFATAPGTYFVADLHALTVPHDPARLRRLTHETALLLLASGLEPDTSTLFVQSHVPEHAELAYLLECTAHVGELGRMIQFKEKGGRPGTRASLFTYPCLMAADILAHETEMVPVGGDQDQHVELTRDLAARFNTTYGETFTVPRLARTDIGSRVANLADATVKMSKSAPDEAAGVVRILDGPDITRRRIMRAVTDSFGEVRHDPQRQPGIANLLEILAACTGARPQDVAERYSSYGALKHDVADAVLAELEPLRRRHDELAAEPAYVEQVLSRGAARASAQAQRVLRRARAAFGIGPG